MRCVPNLCWTKWAEPPIFPSPLILNAKLTVAESAAIKFLKVLQPLLSYAYIYLLDFIWSAKRPLPFLKCLRIRISIGSFLLLIMDLKKGVHTITFDLNNICVKFSWCLYLSCTVLGLRNNVKKFTFLMHFQKGIGCFKTHFKNV